MLTSHKVIWYFLLPMANVPKTRPTLSRSRRNLEILQVFVQRNLKTRYRGSYLGVYWSLLNPLLMTGIYTAIFGAVFAEYYDNSIINYILAAFTGLSVIHFFSGSTSQALRSVVTNGTILNKISLPVSILPASTIAANLFQFSVGTFPLLAIMALFISGNILNSIALILPVAALAFLCTGVGFILAGMYVFFRDLPYFYQLVVYALRIGTPVFYPSEIVPEKVRNVIELNPLAAIIESVRQITLSGDLPDLKLIWGALLSSMLVAVLGWICFQLQRDRFMDLL
ncbi:MAG: ABC transporter permease [Oscillatoria sp. PMC 1050.18]|nr:ABC transporter permease [Oscillatoria sp. PMC 1050.18]